MSEPDPKQFLDFFKSKINKNYSFDPYNLKDKFLKLIEFINDLIKKDATNTIIDINDLNKLITMLNYIYLKYKILYKLLYKFSIRFVENISENNYTLVPLHNEANVEHRKIKIDEIYK